MARNSSEPPTKVSREEISQILAEVGAPLRTFSECQRVADRISSYSDSWTPAQPQPPTAYDRLMRSLQKQLPLVISEIQRGLGPSGQLEDLQRWLDMANVITETNRLYRRRRRFADWHNWGADLVKIY